MIIEAVLGWSQNSLALLSDAGYLQVEKSLSHNEIEKLKDKVKHKLEHYNVHHTTLEIYFNDREFKEEEML